MGRGWFLNFLWAPMILQFKKFIYCEKSTCAPESTTSLPAPADTQQFYFDAHAKFKCGCVPYGTECGPGCRCRVRSPLLYGTAPYYGTGARADARIRTSVRIRVSFLKPDSGLFLYFSKVRTGTGTGSASHSSNRVQHLF